MYFMYRPRVYSKQKTKRAINLTCCWCCRPDQYADRKSNNTFIQPARRICFRSYYQCTEWIIMWIADREHGDSAQYS